MERILALSSAEGSHYAPKWGKRDNKDGRRVIVREVGYFFLEGPIPPALPPYPCAPSFLLFNPRAFPWGRRLHQRRACKFGRDCNNLHVCRHLWTEARASLDDLGEVGGRGGGAGRPGWVGRLEHKSIGWQVPVTTRKRGGGG